MKIPVVLLACGLFAAGTSLRADQRNRIHQVNVDEHGSKTIVKITGTERPSFTAFKLNSPRRLVIDIADSSLQGVPSVIERETGLIKGVGSSQYEGNGTTISRILINFKEESAYRVRVSDNSLIVSLTGEPSSRGTASGPGDRSNKKSVLKKRTSDALKKAKEAEARVRVAEMQAAAAQDAADRAAERKKEIEEENIKAEKTLKDLNARREEMEKALVRLREERREAEIALGRVRNAARGAELARKKEDEKKKELTQARLREEKLVAQIRQKRLDAENESKRALKVKARDQLKRSENERKALLARINNLEQQYGKLKQHVGDRDRELDSARQLLKVQESKVAEAIRMRQEKERELLRAEKRAKDAEIRERRAHVNKARMIHEKSQLEAELKRVKSEFEKAARDKADTEKKLAEARSGAARLKEIERALASTRSEAREEKAKLRKKLVQARYYAEKAARLEERLARAKKIEGEKSDLEKKLAALEDDLRNQKLQQDAEAPVKKSAGTAKPPAALKDSVIVKDIKFSSEGKLQKVRMVTSRPVEYTVSRDDSGNALMEIKGGTLAEKMERTLDVTDFNGPIRTVSSYSRDDGGIAIEIDVSGKTESRIKRLDNGIEWEFESRYVPSMMPALAMNQGDKENTDQTGPQGTKTRTIARENPSEYEYLNEQTSGFVNTVQKQEGTSRNSRKRVRYKGRRIDLDFKDADIHNILRLLADVGHVNIITGEEVSGSVTIRMRNVPWDQALDVILRTKHLGMVREGNLLRVTTLSILEKEREMEIARRKQREALEPLETRLIPVSYATAMDMSSRAQNLLTARGSIAVDGRTNMLIARDTRGALGQVEALIRNLDTQTPQVLIEGRIVEATSTFARQIGIQWGGDFTSSYATGNPTGLAFPSTVSLAGGATDGQTPMTGLSPSSTASPNPNFAVNFPAPAGTGEGGALGLTLGSITNNANLSIRLSAMENTGTVRILSSPRILTLDNKMATIEQGTMIPYSRVSAQGVQTSFQNARLSLQVNPHVTAEGSVMMQVQITRDEPDFNNTGARGDPTIHKRSAKTELLVNDGSTAVIGGIYTRNTGVAFTKVPGLADIPILGWLFKVRNNSDRRTEMLIFITPRIVNRAESIGN